MRVKDLVAKLLTHDPELEVIIDMFSDYDLLDDDCLHVGSAVPASGFVMRSHPTMSAENKQREKLYLYLGNWSIN